MPTLTVTAKGQITLKQELLRHMNIAPGQEVDVDLLPNGRLIIAPATPRHSISKFSGSLAGKGFPKLTIEEIKKITEDAWAGKR
jgi:bifunctional DNA-binding transcriptional regulator/antitoxin component of YhaV-PrlF toxin-antitoxin module